MTSPPPAKRQRRNALRPGSVEIESLREVGALYGLEHFSVGLERFSVGNEPQVPNDDPTVDASESEEGTLSEEEKEEASDSEKSEKHEKLLDDDEK